MEAALIHILRSLRGIYTCEINAKIDLAGTQLHNFAALYSIFFYYLSNTDYGK